MAGAQAAAWIPFPTVDVPAHAHYTLGAVILLVGLTGMLGNLTVIYTFCRCPVGGQGQGSGDTGLIGLSGRGRAKGGLGKLGQYMRVRPGHVLGGSQGPEGPLGLCPVSILSRESTLGT